MSQVPPARPVVDDPLDRFPDDVKQALLARDLVSNYNTGDFIVGPGNQGDHVTFIVAGRASLILCESDEKMVVDELRSGDIFAEVSFFTGGAWPSSSLVVAEEHCRVLEIPAEDFEQILRTAPEIMIPLVTNLGRKVIRLHRAIFEGRMKRRALQDMISRQEHVFPDFFMGDYVRRRVLARVEELAQSDCPVLIIGESGVGKEGIAHSLFGMSHHGKEVFLQVDLLRTASSDAQGAAAGKVHEGEKIRTEKQVRLFFGSEEQAHDGGTKEHPGYFDLTEEGTLLIRGVEKLTRVMQLKILEALVTGTFRRFGGVRSQKGKVRVIATTRLDVSQITPENHPLLHSLMDRSIVIPPLRTRRREIPALVTHYLSRYSQDLLRPVAKLPKETLKILVNYRWPGNDMELAGTLKRAILISQGGVLQPEDIAFDLKKVEGKGTVNLLELGPIKQALKSPLYPAVLQSAVAPFFVILLAILFFGPSDPLKNPASLISWALGWPLLIFGAFLGARSWCAFCPIGTVSNLAKRIVSLNRPFPEFLKVRSDFLVAGAVLLVIWLESATDIRNSPVTLGLLFVAMLASAAVVAVVYERRSWCQHLCGLGGMIGILAKTSLIELRANRNVCISQCSTNDCYVGTGADEGCPFGNAGPRLHSNQLCSLCAKCIKNCPHEAITLNLRMPGREIWETRSPRVGTAFLVLGLIAGLLSEMVVKMPELGLSIEQTHLGKTACFTLMFALFVSALNAALVCAAVMSGRIFNDPFRDNYARFGLALLPLTLAAYLAYHTYYLMELGPYLPRLAGQALGLDALRSVAIEASPALTHTVQVVMLFFGLILSLMVMYRLGRGSSDSFWKILAGSAPHAVLAVALALALDKVMGLFFYP
jgi:transcriptional regulator with AAA-type ATPase domain/polyferredoxin